MRTRLWTAVLWTIAILPVVIILTVIAITVWYLCDPTNPAFGLQLETK